MKDINETLNKLKSLGFTEHWPPSPVYRGDYTVGSIWHYYNEKTKVYLDYCWYTNKFRGFKNRVR